VTRAHRVLLAWSSGKDSAFALHVLRERGLEVVGLLTTINDAFDRVAMHAVRIALLRAQAAAVGLPLHEVRIPWPCPNQAYEAAMAEALSTARAAGVTAVAFGDLFLEDVRRYREDRMAPTGLAPLFPLWGRPTRALAEEMIAVGQKAVLTCVDPRVLAPAFAGRAFDAALLRELPEGVDPCGEKGEFHSFAWDGPAFRHAVPVRVGETVERDGFVFADICPDQPDASPPDIAPGWASPAPLLPAPARR
jgi:uncharacterized protein (TIGR00290 family)